MAKRESREELKARTVRISESLARLYPEARISLDFKTPWQCLAATILSAQCTDERVNQVTPALFAEYPDPAAMAAADPQAEIEISLECPACTCHWTEIFDIDSFFWTELQAWAARILREIHQLASAYGWSEREILALPPLRRNTYLNLIAE